MFYSIAETSTTATEVAIVFRQSEDVERFASRVSILPAETAQIQESRHAPLQSHQDPIHPEIRSPCPAEIPHTRHPGSFGAGD